MDAVYRILGTSQLEAYKDASHGSFFWNWTEEKDNLEWNFQMAHRKRLLSGLPPVLPPRGGACEDPLEKILNPPPAEPRIFMNEPIYMRVFHGRYIDVDRSLVQARWPDKGDWQELCFCSPVHSVAKTKAQEWRALSDGDVVRIRSKSGRYFTTDKDGNISAVSSRAARGTSSEFVLRIEGAQGSLLHQGGVYLENRASRQFLDADEDRDGIYARYEDRGSWQLFHVDKADPFGVTTVPRTCPLLALAPPAPATAPAPSPHKTPQKRTRVAREESAKSKGAPPQKRGRLESQWASQDIC